MDQAVAKSPQTIQHAHSGRRMMVFEFVGRCVRGERSDAGLSLF